MTNAPKMAPSAPDNDAARPAAQPVQPTQKQQQEKQAPATPPDGAPESGKNA